MTSGDGGGITLLTSEGRVGSHPVEGLVALDDDLRLGVVDHGVAFAGAGQAHPVRIPGEGQGGADAALIGLAAELVATRIGRTGNAEG